MCDDPIKAILDRHGIHDPSDHLLSHSNARIDVTPRIDGYPVSNRSREEVNAKLARGCKLFWFNLQQRVPWILRLRKTKPIASCSCEHSPTLAEVRAHVLEQHGAIAKEVADDLPNRR